MLMVQWWDKGKSDHLYLKRKENVSSSLSFEPCTEMSGYSLSMKGNKDTFKTEESTYAKA